MWVLASVIGTIAAAYIVLCALCYLFQERFIFVRFPLRRDHRFHFQQPFEEMWLKRPDGAELHALHFKVPDAKGLVLYFHGNTGHLKRWGRRADRFTRLGYDVLMPDPRGYGKSKGRTSEAALIGDATAWADMARGMHGKLVIYGCSLGCALAVPVAAEQPAAMLLLETPFANLAEVARHHFPFLPYRWLLRYPFKNDERISGVKCPVHFFHGRRDQVVPYNSALRLYAATPAQLERSFHTYPRGRHNDLYRFEEFRAALRRLLD